MNRYYVIPQCHIFIARIGEGGVTADAAPAHSSAAWKKFGNAPEGGKLRTEVDMKERVNIVAGQRLTENHELGRKFTATLSIEELNKLVVDMVFKSNTTATDDFISQGTQSSACWVQLQGYDQGDANRFLLQGKGPLIPSGDFSMGGTEWFSQDFEIRFDGKVAGKLVGAYPA